MSTGPSASDKDELKELYHLRDALNVRIARLEQRAIFPVSKNGAGDAVVYTKDIRPYVQGWIDEGYTLQSLADKADISVATLYNILQRTRPTVKENTVDKILQALGLPHVYNDIFPEPPEDYHYTED